jgi:hypothetical protein
MTQAVGRVLAAWAYSEANDPVVLRHLHDVLTQLECDPPPLESTDSSSYVSGPYPQSDTARSGYALCLGCGTIYSRVGARHHCHG